MTSIEEMEKSESENFLMEELSELKVDIEEKEKWENRSKKESAREWEKLMENAETHSYEEDTKWNLWEANENESIENWDNPWEDWKEKENPRTVHAMLQVWKIVIPDFADVASTNATAFTMVDISNKKMQWWVRIVNINDFGKNADNPESSVNPLGKVTVVYPYMSRQVGEKASVTVGTEFAFIERMPQWNWITATVAWSYDMGKGRTINWDYFHSFPGFEDLKDPNVKWNHSDAIRIWITKKVNEALDITAQWRYKTDYDKKFFGRIIADINLWNGFWAQMSCILKNWKLEPTAWVFYKF